MNIDFRKAVLRGEKDEYVFDRTISSSGSQGVTMRFLRRTDGFPVVFKWYEQTEEGGSTQFANEDHVKEAHFDSWLNESDFLQHLSVIAKLGRFYGLHREELHADHRDRCFYWGNEKVSFETFCRMAVVQKEYAGLLDSQTTVFPVLVDRICDIYDESTKEVHVPVLGSGSRVADFAVFFDRGPGEGDSPVSTCIEGRTLDDVLMHPLGDERHFQIASNLLEATSVLHWFGVMHRDIKPDNVIVRDDDKVFLVDFGIAQFFSVSDHVAYLAGFPDSVVAGTNLSRSRAISRSMFGSRLFSSPQALEQKMACPSDDIYSAGLLAAVVLTGRHPYLPEGMTYAQYRMLPSAERKSIHRAVKAFLTEKNPRGVDAAYAQYVANHGDRISAVSDLFSPDVGNRPPRMTPVMERLKIPLPSFPPIADVKECDELQIKYRPRNTGEQLISAALNEKRNVHYVPFFDLGL